MLPTHPPFNRRLAEGVAEPGGELIDFRFFEKFGVADIIGFTGHVAIDAKPSCKLLVGYLRLLFDFLHLLLQSFSECTFAVK